MRGLKWREYTLSLSAFPIAIPKIEFNSRYANSAAGLSVRSRAQSSKIGRRGSASPASPPRSTESCADRAVDWELLDQSPMKGIKFLPENNACLRYLLREECDRLVESCIAPHLRAIVTVALHTGMRSGEIRSLQWNDLDFDSGFIIIRDSKNGEPRHVPMDLTVVDLFSNYSRTPGSEFVFTNAAGGRL